MDLQSFVSTLVSKLASDPLLDLVLVLLLITLIALFMLSRRVSLLTHGTSGASLEDTIAKLGERMNAAESYVETSKTALNNLDERMQDAVRSVSVHRYDPFEGAGGQQSFTSVLLNERGDGVVISGIHARDSVRVYAKEVKDFKSDRELSTDELATVESAKKRLQ